MSPRPVRLSRGQVAAILHRPKTMGPKNLIAKAKQSRRNQPEHAMQVAFFEWLDTDCDGICDGIAQDAHAIPNAARRSLRHGAKMKAEGMRAGVPDICLDRAHGGFFGMKLELKDGAQGRVSEAQSTRLKRLCLMGYYAVVARSLDQAKELTLGYVNMPRTRVAK